MQTFLLNFIPRGAPGRLVMGSKTTPERHGTLGSHAAAYASAPPGDILGGKLQNLSLIKSWDSTGGCWAVGIGLPLLVETGDEALEYEDEEYEDEESESVLAGESCFSETWWTT